MTIELLVIWASISLTLGIGNSYLVWELLRTASKESKHTDSVSDKTDDVKRQSELASCRGGQWCQEGWCTVLSTRCQ